MLRTEIKLQIILIRNDINIIQDALSIENFYYLQSKSLAIANLLSRHFDDIKLDIIIVPLNSIMVQANNSQKDTIIGNLITFLLLQFFNIIAIKGW